VFEGLIPAARARDELAAALKNVLNSLFPKKNVISNQLFPNKSVAKPHLFPH
jgi:hypothetical protein